MHFGPVQADRSQFQHTCLLGEQEHLHEEGLQFWKEGAPKGGERIVVGMLVACDEAKGHGLIGSALDLTRTEHPGGIAIQQQAQQHFGGIRLSSTLPIVSIQSREIELSHAVYHKAGQMIGKQTISQSHRQIESLIVVDCFESSLHALKYIMDSLRFLFLSDRLLESPTPRPHYNRPAREERPIPGVRCRVRKTHLRIFVSLQHNW